MLVQFAASPEFMKKLSRARALLAHRGGGFEQVFELALDLLLDQRDPQRRNAWRAKRRAGKPASISAHTSNASQPKQRAGAPALAPNQAMGNVPRAKRSKEKRTPTPTNNPRHIAAPIRDRVFERDGGRCTYVSQSGRRCTTRYYLQVDHVRPVARGGTGTMSNLRLLCGAHNRIEAERLLGRSCGSRHESGAPDPGATSGVL